MKSRLLTQVSCVDVLQNMQDEAWMSKLEVCGQVERVWETFVAVRTDDDQVRTSRVAATASADMLI